jgi:hypothetical protein
MVNYIKIYKGALLKSKTPAHWNLIGHRMTAPTACVIAQQYPSATFVSLHFQRIIRRAF